MQVPTTTFPPRPPMGQLIIYALGQLGWSLASFGAANLLIYFYMPPEPGQEVIFPNYIYQGAILGVATLIGFITFGGRIFDAFTDPWIANWSDRQPRQGGKRKRVMGWAAIPFALLSLLVFYPPFGENLVANAAWLVVIVFLFYLAFTLYLVPYNALISELGHHPPDRMKISTLISVTWALGFVLGNMVYAIQGAFEASYSPTVAFQLTVAVFAGIALVLMFLPVFFLQEERYAHQPVDTIKQPSSSFWQLFQDKNFTYFLASDLLYWLALTFVQLGVSFYVTILFGYEKEMASQYATISFLASFLFYWPVNAIVKRFGKRLPMQLAFVAFCLVFLFTAGLNYLSLPKTAAFYGLAILSAFPLAAFGIIPNALIADFVYEYEDRTGLQQAGMFYAIRNFMMKVGISLSSLLFPSFLLLGKSSSEPLGVEVSALAAAIFCLAGWALFRQVKLPEVKV